MFFTSAITNVNEFSEIRASRSTLNPSKVCFQIAENESKPSNDSEFEVEDKSNKEDLKVEQPQLIQSNPLESIFEAPVKIRDLANRQDVVNKSSLRKMKRYYIN